jgi:hypothetical protein
VYLNRNWKQGDGGELVLQPFLGEAITVEPSLGKFICFFSDKMLHRVQPSRVARFCFTVWIDGENVNRPESVNLMKKHITFSPAERGLFADAAEATDFFRTSPLQRAISRAVYDDEYQRSITQCMLGPTRTDRLASRALLTEHEAYVKSILANPAIATFIDQLVHTGRATSDPAGSAADQGNISPF